MQQPWWFHVRDLTQHVLGNSTMLFLAALVCVLDSALLEFSVHLIHSKFVFHILEILGYAVVMVDAALIGLFLVKRVWSGLKGV
jgi:hypothetical protein